MLINKKADFDCLIDKIKNLVSKYENNVSHYNRYQMYLANGEKLNFEILEQTIPHLLGIRLDYLRATNLFKNKDAFSLLKEFLENSNSVYRNVCEGHLTFSSLFSNYLQDKLDSFEKVITYFSPNDIEFICKYSKSKTYQLDFKTDYPCDYFIAKKENNGDIYLLGLVRQGNCYMPMTSLKFSKEENQSIKLKELLTNQTLTFSNNINICNPITGFGNNAYLSLAYKADKVRNLKKYATLGLGIALDVSSDYQYLIQRFSMKDNKVNSYKLLCQKFSTTIKERELFLIEQMDENLIQQLDSEMMDVIEAYNNGICHAENGKVQMVYSDLIKEYKKLEEQVLCLEQQLLCIKEQTQTDQQEIKLLQEENETLKGFQEDILEVVKRQREKAI